MIAGCIFIAYICVLGLNFAVNIENDFVNFIEGNPEKVDFRLGKENKKIANAEELNKNQEGVPIYTKIINLNEPPYSEGKNNKLVFYIPIDTSDIKKDKDGKEPYYLHIKSSEVLGNLNFEVEKEKDYFEMTIDTRFRKESRFFSEFINSGKTTNNIYIRKKLVNSEKDEKIIAMLSLEFKGLESYKTTKTVETTE